MIKSISVFMCEISLLWESFLFDADELTSWSGTSGGTGIDSVKVGGKHWLELVKMY